MTSRHAAQRALEQLEHAQARFVGAVLNRVDLEHNAYYYSQYYRREVPRGPLRRRVLERQQNHVAHKYRLRPDTDSRLGKFR